MAVTNDGIAIPIVVAMRIVPSVRRPRTPATTPSRIPPATIRNAPIATSAAVTPMRGASSVLTGSREIVERPRSPSSTPVTHSQ